MTTNKENKLGFKKRFSNWWKKHTEIFSSPTTKRTEKVPDRQKTIYAGNYWKSFLIWFILLALVTFIVWEGINGWPITRWTWNSIFHSGNKKDSPDTPPTVVTITPDSLTVINQLKNKVARLEKDLAAEKSKNASVSTPSPVNSDCQNTVAALQKDKESLTKQLASVESKLKQTAARKDKPGKTIYVNSPPVVIQTETKQQYGKPTFTRNKAYFPKTTTIKTTVTPSFN
jgi:hypothetical protein